MTGSSRQVRIVPSAFSLPAAAGPMTRGDTGSQPVRPPAPEYGPAAGTFVIVVGGPLEGSGIIAKFIELAGGPDKETGTSRQADRLCLSFRPG